MFSEALLSLSFQLIVLDMVILVVLLSNSHHILEVARGGDLILRSFLLLETLEGGLHRSLGYRCPEILQPLLILFWWLILTEIVGLFIVLLMSPIVNQLDVSLIMGFCQFVVRIGNAISTSRSLLMSSTEPVHYAFLLVRSKAGS